MSAAQPGPDGLVAYVAARDREHAQQIADALAALTSREKALVREAAVMGYVQGMGRSMVPPDSAIVARVVGACLAMASLYPTIAGEASR